MKKSLFVLALWGGECASVGTFKQRRIEKRLLVLGDGSANSSLHRRYFYITSTPFLRSKSVEIPLKER